MKVPGSNLPHNLRVAARCSLFEFGLLALFAILALSVALIFGAERVDVSVGHTKVLMGGAIIAGLLLFGAIVTLGLFKNKKLACYAYLATCVLTIAGCLLAFLDDDGDLLDVIFFALAVVGGYHIYLHLFGKSDERAE